MQPCSLDDQYQKYENPFTDIRKTISIFMDKKNVKLMYHLFRFGRLRRKRL